MKIASGALLAAWCSVLPLITSLAVVGIASAEAPTCRGQAATLVGSPGSSITGTRGPDVIVTMGAQSVDARGGDDLVCVTGAAGRRGVSIEVGDGDDVVDASDSASPQHSVRLDEGDDEFRGSPARDYVYAGDAYARPPGMGADIVSTGAGDDSIETGGRWGRVDRDEIDLGPGDDEAWVQGPLDPALPLDLGDGEDSLELTFWMRERPLMIDNRRQRASSGDDVGLAWTGHVRDFGAWGWKRAEPVSFTGSDDAERVALRGAVAAADLGGGDDELEVTYDGRTLPSRLDYDGGDGVDSIMIDRWNWPPDMLRADLEAERLAVRMPQGRVRGRLAAFEQHTFLTLALDVTGSLGPDSIRWTGCEGRVRGGPGDDTILTPGATCRGFKDPGRVVVAGGAGDDNLVGGRDDDVLRGGRGDDRADGRQGRDRCRVEDAHRCERPRVP